MKSLFKMISLKLALLLLITAVINTSCRKPHDPPPPVPLPPNTKIPNIVIILADDMGYEIPQFTGGQSYQTPTLNSLASSGMQFTHCYSTPNCTPSRIMLLTGKYNFRNYTDWSILDLSQKTIANALNDHGYKTCVAGKWQLDGGDASIKAFGFNDYMIWDPFASNDTLGTEEGRGRYKSPDIYQNGAFIDIKDTRGKYSEDMFTDFVCNFIQNNSNKPMFIYYPMILGHTPYSPTPDDPEFATFNPDLDKPDVKYFRSMTAYMDKKIQLVVDKLKWAGVYDNTYIFFTSDNGTGDTIVSNFNGRLIRGGKGTPTEFGTHVPLIVSGASKILPGSVNNNLIDFTDFFSTVLDICKIDKSSLPGYGQLDGDSFFPELKGAVTKGRSWIYCYWKPYTRVPALYKVYAQTSANKLYDSETNRSHFYNLLSDSFELNPLKDEFLTLQEKANKQLLQNVLDSLHY